MANGVKKPRRAEAFGKKKLKKLGKKDSILRRLKRKSIKELERLGI